MNGKCVLMMTAAVVLILCLGIPLGAGEFFFRDGDTNLCDCEGLDTSGIRTMIGISRP